MPGPSTGPLVAPEVPLALSSFDVVVVPFPFTDRLASKRRPAVVVSAIGFNGNSGNAVLAMVTSAEQSSWPGDMPIRKLAAAGLSSPCVVRLKLFTLDQRLILRKAGRLAAVDITALQKLWGPLLLQNNS
jgi:mRNA interferase MazF